MSVSTEISFFISNSLKCRRVSSSNCSKQYKTWKRRHEECKKGNDQECIGSKTYTKWELPGTSPLSVSSSWLQSRDCAQQGGGWVHTDSRCCGFPLAYGCSSQLGLSADLRAELRTQTVATCQYPPVINWNTNILWMNTFILETTHWWCCL